MDLKEMCINKVNWVDSAEGRECSIEPPGSISEGVTYICEYVCVCVQILGKIINKMY